jgi:acyl-CoA synthetase (NDP forming)
VAVVGASNREESMGEWAMRNLARGKFPGPVYPVNPGYEELGGIRCYPRLADLPEVPELVIFAVGDHRVEQTLDEAIALKIPAAVIHSSLYVDDDQPPCLRERVRRKVREAGMLVCGGNGMGFYNVRDNTWACGFDSRLHEGPGNASLISQSGSGMAGIIDCEARLRVNFACSTGNELSVTMDQYIDFALDLPETRVVGLFIETARKPDELRAALAKAMRKRIPVVALKVGKTRKSAELAVSHCGAMAGDDATYEALFARYGVHRVHDLDEMATAMILFAELNPLGPGGLVSLHDSGGERQLIVDLCDAAGVPLTELSPDTVEKIRRSLAPELPAVNPLDAWSRGGPNSKQETIDCMTAMLQDEGTAMGVYNMDRAPDGGIYEYYEQYLKEPAASAGKPTVLVSSRQGSGEHPLAVSLTHEGFPVLDGLTTFLDGVRGLMAYRDFQALDVREPAAADPDVTSKWRARLGENQPFDEFTSLSMLRDFGLSTTAGRLVDSGEALLAACREMSFPLVLKTAMPGILHKTEHAGVRLGIGSEAELAAAYAEMAARLGPAALLTEMVGDGVEMILGARRDPQFGLVVMMGFGGILAEVTRDVTFALPPFDTEWARRSIDGLQLRPLLDGVRGRPPAAIEQFCEMAAAFSVMVDALADDLREIDINPVIVGSNYSTAVDALVVGGAGNGKSHG